MKNKTKKHATIYIVRHGQSQSNQKEVLGQRDSKLSDEGIKQAQIRGEDFKNIKFDAVFSSKFVRARQTAELIAKKQNIVKIITLEALGERSWGKWENNLYKKDQETFKKLRDEYEKLTKEERYTLKLAQDMESDKEALKRFKGVIKKLANKYKGKTILLVSHGNILKILLVHIGFGSWKELPSGAITNTGYAILHTDGEEFFVKNTKGITKKSI